MGREDKMVTCEGTIELLLLLLLDDDLMSRRRGLVRYKRNQTVFASPSTRARIQAIRIVSFLRRRWVASKKRRRP